MGTVFQDFRYGFRVLCKSPGFIAVAVIVLALGIGANTAIFSVVNAVLLRPLPFEQSDRIVAVWHVPPAKSFPGLTKFAVSPANYFDWVARNRVFEKMAIYGFHAFNVTGGDRPEAVKGAEVSADFFPLLRVQPILGRGFTPAEDQPGNGHVVILSYGYWQTHLGADPQVIGRQITLNGEPYSVVGVMAKKFHMPDWAEMWAPTAWPSSTRAVRSNHNYMVLGRLRSGVDIQQAQAEMKTISSALEQQYPEDDKGWSATVVPLHEDIVEDVRPSLLVLLGAVAFVLLIACANVANLALARTLGRRKEIAIRTSLGASHARLLQQFLAESVLLALTGGALGLVLAHFGVKLITAFLGDRLPRFLEVGLDGWVLTFTLTISVVTGIVAGIVPAWRASKSNPNDALKQGLGRTGSDSGGNRTRSALVVSEVALSLMLLIGAGLMIRSLWKLHGVDPGFDSHNVLTMMLPVAGSQFPSPEQMTNYFSQIVQQARNLPGVESVAAVDNLPLSNDGSTQPVAFEGRPAGSLAEQPEVAVRLVSADYFHTLHIPVMKGRGFSESDTKDKTPVVVISQSMANRFWPNEDPIGKHLVMSFYPGVWREVVGVVGDVKLTELKNSDPNATLYWPVSQLRPANGETWGSFGLALAVRTRANPEKMSSAVANAIHQVNGAQPIEDVESLDNLLYDSITPQRLNMLLLAVFAGLALVLAAVGIYSVLSYGVKRRVREIGIRMALGAQIQDVLRMIVIEGMRPTLIGVALGLGGALALGSVLQNLIFGVKTSDPITFGSVSLLLASVAFFASIIPAYRATKVEPMKALRDE
jgi:putative ABC transport system permease protein